MSKIDDLPHTVSLEGPSCTERYDPSPASTTFALNNRLIYRFMFFEMLGSFFLVLLSSMTVLAILTPENKANFFDMSFQGILILAISNAMVYVALLTTVMRYNFPINYKGTHYFLVGHINPMVTLFCAIINEITWAHATVYWTAQIFGSVMAAVALTGIVPWSLQTDLGALNMGSDFNVGLGITIEFIITSLFIFVIYLQVIYPGKQRDEIYLESVTPLTLGAFVFILTLIFGEFSGACMNPFKTLSSMFISGKWSTTLVAHIIGPLLGTITASLLILFKTKVYLLCCYCLQKDVKEERNV